MEQILSKLGELPTPAVVALLLAIMILGALTLWVIVKVCDAVENYFVDRRIRKQFSIDLQQYQEHINSLPLLRNNHLLMVEGEVSPKLARTFDSRYDGLVIYDEFGQMWIGMRTPEIMEDLIAGEYLQSSYWIPFCGPGEAFVGEPVEVNGVELIVYPTLLRSLPLTDRRWEIWASIQKNYEAIRSDRRVFLKYREALPYDQRFKIERDRLRFGYVQPQFG